mmetsp:Transcript_79995/g.166346  ORF Transcript_79995/g.166346 Transcript_79995/m.166346 type:complete len:251 (+) Transcript_79995:268-1020(+)
MTGSQKPSQTIGGNWEQAGVLPVLFSHSSQLEPSRVPLVATFFSCSLTASFLRGAMLRSKVISTNSSKEMSPLPSVSKRSKKAFMAASSMFSKCLRSFFEGVAATCSGTKGTGISPLAMRVASSSPTYLTNCSVVKPSGPERSRVPFPVRKALYMASRQWPVHRKMSSLLAGCSTAACSMAPKSATTMPRGFMEVSSPRWWAYHKSATVPWEASNSLIKVPSALLPIKLEVMKPGLRCTWATSSVSMSPS